MAQATSLAVGVREDLTNVLTILSPEETPKLSSFSKTKAPSNMLQEWQVDDLSAPAFEGTREGQDQTEFANKAANRARIGNYVQEIRRPWAVSQFIDKLDVAAVSSEKANAIAKSMRELKRDLEAAIGSDNDRATDDGINGYKLRGLGDWIDSAGPADVPAFARTPANSINTTATSSLTETNFNAVLQSRAEATGMAGKLTLFAGPNLKRKISEFQRQTSASAYLSYQVNQDATENRIDLKVDLYDSDFGVVNIVLDQFNGVTSAPSGGTYSITNQSRARGYLIDPDLVGISYLWAMKNQELPDLGGGARGYVTSALTLQVKNPKGLGKFAATS